jgi:integrase
LRVGDVRDDTVFADQTKSGKPRAVPLSAEGARFFTELMQNRRREAPLFLQANGERWHRMRISRAMKLVNTAAELDPPARFHDLRRSYASLFINAGAGAERNCWATAIRA